ncbi:MAG TPA: hypothetical protein VGG48_09025 [Rhizomicrobium sp.]
MVETQRGWALVSVLWVVAILSMLAASSEQLTVISAHTEHRSQDITRAETLLDGAVARAVAGIEDPDLTQRWRIDGVARDFAFDGAHISVSVQDQLGCMDINAVDVSALRELLQGAGGLNAEAASDEADKILDWRSTADLHRLHGATDADYAQAGLPYRQRHASFQTVEELKLVMGMTPTLFARIRPALTVYSHRPSFDSNLAPHEVLLGLYLDDPKQADTIIAQREAGTGSERNTVAPGIAGASTSFSGRAFAVDAALVLHDKVFRRHAVVETTADPKAPYIVLAWR